MKTIFKVSLALTILLAVSTQCTNRTEKEKDDLSEYIEANINYCMTPLIEKGVDSVQARTVCKCVFEQLFEIEPDIRDKSAEEWNQIFNSNRDKIIEECPEIKEFYENAKK